MALCFCDATLSYVLVSRIIVSDPWHTVALLWYLQAAVVASVLEVVYVVQ